MKEEFDSVICYWNTYNNAKSGKLIHMDEQRYYLRTPAGKLISFPKNNTLVMYTKDSITSKNISMVAGENEMQEPKKRR